VEEGLNPSFEFCNVGMTIAKCSVLSLIQFLESLGLPGEPAQGMEVMSSLNHPIREKCDSGEFCATLVSIIEYGHAYAKSSVRTLESAKWRFKMDIQHSGEEATKDPVTGGNLSPQIPSVFP
jgi:hypothetical protein